MNAFEKLQQIHTDYAVCIGAFNAAQDECKEIIKSVRDRLTAERERDAARMVELERQAADSSRSATVRRLAAEELEQLRDRTYSATEAEKSAFAEQTKIAEQAVSDAAAIRTTARTSVDAANAEIERARAAILGDANIDLRPRWLDRLNDASGKL